MRQVILTVGPRGAGKTTFCQEIIKLRPEVVMIERDALFNELVRDTWQDPSLGNFHYGYKVMMKKVEEVLKPDPVILILDSWTGDAIDRWRLIKNLRQCGADRITAWYFVTAEDSVVSQFMKKSKFSQEDEVMRNIETRFCRRNYRVYHSHPVDLEQGFDDIELINPDQLTLFPYAEILL